MASAPPPTVLPVGTRVVTRIAVVENGVAQHPPGAVGIVVAAPVDPDHGYRVRFPGGVEVVLVRRELTLLAAEKDARAGAPDAMADRGLWDHVIYRCVVGSRAYGLATDGSDTDRRGVYLPPASLHWSLAGVPEQLEDDAAQSCYWELQKFLLLALKANPNVLECLWTPLVEHADPVARALLGMREAFLSKLVHATYAGYAMSQFEKLNADLDRRNAGGWKHAMHLLRLLRAGTDLLRTGVLTVDVGDERARLLAVKAGQVAWAEVDRWRTALHREFDAAYATTRLPDRPDYARVERFLRWARRRVVDVDDAPSPEAAP